MLNTDMCMMRLIDFQLQNDGSMAGCPRSGCVSSSSRLSTVGVLDGSRDNYATQFADSYALMMLVFESAWTKMVVNGPNKTKLTVFPVCSSTSKNCAKWTYDGR